MYVCIIRMYTYVHTCYVLTNPPIPSSPCNHMANLHKLFFCIAREGPRGPIRIYASCSTRCSNIDLWT